MSINNELFKLARSNVKKAFQPPMDPSQQQPPMDPSQGGGAPPGMDPSMMQGGGGAPPPPMDPSMVGGGAPPPPPDPSMGGAPVGGAGGLNADSIRQIMQEVLGQMGMIPGQAGPGGGAAGGKPGKPDLLAMSNDIFQIKKMLSGMYHAMGLELPQDILDGPNRDPSTGAPMPPNSPGSTSDPTRQSPPMGGAAGGGQNSPDSAIKPISPMQGAFPAGGGAGGGGGGEKTSSTRLGEGVALDKVSHTGKDVRNKAAALNAVLRKKLKTH